MKLNPAAQYSKTSAKRLSASHTIWLSPTSSELLAMPNEHKFEAPKLFSSTCMGIGLFKATVTLVNPVLDNMRSLPSYSRKASASAADALSSTASQAFKAMEPQTYHRIVAISRRACSSAQTGCCSLPALFCISLSPGILLNPNSMERHCAFI
eukprot:6188033-Pleurochrysis_carterae.AAC.1